jgi:hypothetical protein
LETTEDPVSSGPVLAFRPLKAIAHDDFKMSWTHRGWASHPSHGETAGPHKSLKSWLEAIEVTCIAAGKPLFGRFQSVTHGPVLVFSGEVADTLYLRRIRHIGRAIGLQDSEIDKLPIHVCDQRATTRSSAFKTALADGLEKLQPVRVSLDPLYSYHGADVEASNVHASAEVRNAVSDITSEYGASLRIVNHFRKDAHGRPQLIDITQAGGREWVDSWILVSHRQTPDLAASKFWLAIEVGGRHWGGSSWDLDISLGDFDLNTFDWTGDLTWVLQEHDAEAAAERKEQREAADRMVDHAAAVQLGQFTWEQFAEAVGRNESESKTKKRIRNLMKHDQVKPVKSGGNGKLAIYEAIGTAFSFLSGNNSNSEQLPPKLDPDAVWKD